MIGLLFVPIVFVILIAAVHYVLVKAYVGDDWFGRYLDQRNEILKELRDSAPDSREHAKAMVKLKLLDGAAESMIVRRHS